VSCQMHSGFILQWSHCKRFTIVIYIHREWHCIAYCADVPLRIYSVLTHSLVIVVTQAKGIGQILFDAVVHKLQLVESDYFDLEFTDHESIPVSLSNSYSQFTTNMYVL